MYILLSNVKSKLLWKLKTYINFEFMTYQKCFLKTFCLNNWLITDWYTFFQLESLALDLITQLQSKYLTDELANQIIKNMVFIAKVAKLLSDKESSSDSVEQKGWRGSEGKKCLSLRWLVKKMVREANHEAVNQPKTTIKVSYYSLMCLWYWENSSKK